MHNILRERRDRTAYRGITSLETIVKMEIYNEGMHM